MNKQMSKFGSGILETLNLPSSSVYWVYMKSILSLNHLCKSTICSIFAGLRISLFVPVFLPISVHLL